MRQTKEIVLFNYGEEMEKISVLVDALAEGKPGIAKLIKMAINPITLVHSVEPYVMKVLEDLNHFTKIPKPFSTAHKAEYGVSKTTIDTITKSVKCEIILEVEYQGDSPILDEMQEEMFKEGLILIENTISKSLENIMGNHITPRAETLLQIAKDQVKNDPENFTEKVIFIKFCKSFGAFNADNIYRGGSFVDKEVFGEIEGS